MSEQFSLIIGPCSMESFEQMLPIAELAKSHAITQLRAPLFKPRTHPDSFQGLGISGISILRKLETVASFNWVTEVLSAEHIELVIPHVQILQIGARNMQNFELLKAIGQKSKGLESPPKVLLKRGFQSTLEEWLAANLYLERYGVRPENIILCERGTRNFPSPTGVSLDLVMALEAKKKTGQKVIIDPSHGTRTRSWVFPMIEAAKVIGLDGAMIEVHPRPESSVSDAFQAVSVEELRQYLIQ